MHGVERKRASPELQGKGKTDRLSSNDVLPCPYNSTSMETPSMVLSEHPGSNSSLSDVISVSRQQRERAETRAVAKTPKHIWYIHI